MKKISSVTLFLFSLFSTATLYGAEGNCAAKIHFTPYKDNPVLTQGAAGEWDSGIAWAPAVIFHDGQYHMFYGGTTEMWVQPIGTGHATSADGLSWTKDESNPVLPADGTGFDA